LDGSIQESRSSLNAIGMSDLPILLSFIAPLKLKFSLRYIKYRLVTIYTVSSVAKRISARSDCLQRSYKPYVVKYIPSRALVMTSFMLRRFRNCRRYY